MASDATFLNLEKIYRQRFAGMDEYRIKLWGILCRDFFQAFIPQTATIVELASGHCEFINQIQAARRIALDINPDTAQYAATGVEVLLEKSWDVKSMSSNSVDIIFISNFLEHLSKEKIVVTLREAHRQLKAGGKILILQPNIRYTYRDYWMFFDHITPLDDRALCEVLKICDFRVRQCLPRFLPYTTQSRLPKSLGLVRLYLKLPILWRLFGQQCFIQAEKNF